MQIYHLSNGRIRPATLERIEKRSFTWIRAVAPTHEEFQQLMQLSGIPLEELKESIEEEERPRLTKKKYIEIIYDTPHNYRQEGLQTMEINCYIIGNLLITIEEEPTAVLNKLEAKCKESRSAFMFASQGAFLFHLLDEINDEFLLRIDRVARRLEALRNRELTRVDVNQLYDASISLAYFNQAIIANLEVLNQLRKMQHKAFTQEDRANFNEVYVDKLQILDTEKIQRELIMHLISIQSIRSTENLNRTMKRLTALALVIALPTLISSMYGMNIQLPLADHPHAFAILFVLMAAFSAALLYIMHKLDWI